MSMNSIPSTSSSNPMSRSEALGKAIHDARESKEITREQLSEYLGCNILIMQLIEEGFWIPSELEIAIIAKAVGAPTARLTHLADAARAEEALIRLRWEA
jgi:transcriptional regulator with XRE-family HTH domain